MATFFFAPPDVIPGRGLALLGLARERSWTEAEGLSRSGFLARAAKREMAT